MHFDQCTGGHNFGIQMHINSPPKYGGLVIFF